jgi:hypothetical protein
MMCIFSFFFFFFWALYSGQTFCIHMDCTDIDYCIYGQCLWFSIYDYVYGCWFMVMCFWMYGCIFGYVYGYWMCLWLCVSGCMDVFLAMCMDIGSRSPARPGSSISGLTPPWGPFPLPLGLTLPRGPFQQILGLTPPRGPFPQSLGLTPSRGLFRMTLRIFPIFLRQKWKNFAPVCSVE